MLDKNNEVLFGEYCKTCKYKNYSETDSPCAECLAEPVNLYSHKPVKWEGADGIYAGPPPRPDHAYQRAVKYVPENRKDREKAIARHNIDAEYNGNKVQTIDDKVTDDQYPSATAVKKALEGANEATAQSLARKIDAPDNCDLGEFLAVEEVNEDGVVTKVKGAKVQTEPPDLSENDPTKPGYVKNRTHYDSRVIKTIEKTFENITETKPVKLADADIDINRIVSYSVSVTDGENTYNFITTDILIEDISEKFNKPTGSAFAISPNDGPGPVLQYLAVPFEIPNQSGDGSDAMVTYHGLYCIVDAGSISVKFEINIESGELKKLDQKYIPEIDPSKIKDMYYEEAGTDTKGLSYNIPITSEESTHEEIPFEVGQKWNVYTNGSTLYSENAEVKKTSNGILYIGDYPTPAPYYVTKTTVCGLRFWISNAQVSSITITCVESAKKIHKIPIRYLPDNVFTQDNAPAKFGMGSMSVVEGDSQASGMNAHAEGTSTSASGDYSHAEGNNTTASGKSSHAEGTSTSASGDYSHAEGFYTFARGSYSHTEGIDTDTYGIFSHAEGNGTVALAKSQHVQGEYNIPDSSTPTKRGMYADIVGNGKSSTVLSNAYTLDWYGNGWFAGDVYVGSTSGTKKDSGSKKLIKEGDDIIIQSSTEGSTKKFKITVDDNGTISATEVTA